METYRRLLLNNKAWVQEKLSLTEDYFSELAGNESPRFFWIGCSDSEVPAEDITGTQPGELFVHRNIGNLVVNDDQNLLSSIQYAVEILNVKHIIVCGHYGCNGVKLALEKMDKKNLDNWLNNIRNVHDKHLNEFAEIKNQKDVYKRLVEFNVQEQVKNLMNTDIVKENWQKSQWPVLHGWIFDVETGVLNDIIRQLPEK